MGHFYSFLPLFVLRIFYLLEVVLYILLSPLILLPGVQLFPPGLIGTLLLSSNRQGSDISRLLSHVKGSNEARLLSGSSNQFLPAFCYVREPDFPASCKCTNIDSHGGYGEITLFLEQPTGKSRCLVDVIGPKNSRLRLTREETSLDHSETTQQVIVFYSDAHSTKDKEKGTLGANQSLVTVGNTVRLTFETENGREKKPISSRRTVFKVKYHLLS